MGERLAGRVVADSFRWLEPDDSGDGERWLAEQAERLARAEIGWSQPRSRFAAALARHYATAPVSASPPVWRRDRKFFLRQDPGHERPVLVCQIANEPERVLVDPIAINASGLATLQAWRPSWSGELIAYQIATAGSESPTLRIADTTNGRDMDAPLYPDLGTAVAWSSDDTGFYYVTCPGDGPRRVQYHRLGDPPGEDRAVFETDSRQLSVSTSPCGRWLAISSAPGAQRGNRIHVVQLETGDAPELIFDGVDRHTQALLKFGPAGLLYAITTEHAPGGRVCLVDPARPHSASWTPLVDPDDAAVVSDAVATTDPTTAATRFLVATSRGGVVRLTLHDQHGTSLGEVGPADRRGTISKLTAPRDVPGTAWFAYTDFVTVPMVYRVEVSSRRCHPETEQPRPPALTGSAAAPPSVRHLSYPSDDGTDIPVFVIAPDDDDRPRPAILTGYGGFAAIATPSYSPSILSWVEAGGIYVVAAIRGGGEYGTAWHAAGRGHHKVNAIADYAAAARWLVAEDLTTPAQLAVKGSSHAGLMVAAAITRDPHLYAAAVCAAPVTDMVRYPRLGLGQWWLDEFGDPEDPDDLDVLLSYSPYHRVLPGTPYPAVLMISGRYDARVGAAHARKFTAALQQATSSTEPIVLRTEHGVGHGLPATTRLIDREADALAFVAAHTGLAHG